MNENKMEREKVRNTPLAPLVRGELDSRLRRNDGKKKELHTP